MKTWISSPRSVGIHGRFHYIEVLLEKAQAQAQLQAQPREDQGQLLELWKRRSRGLGYNY